MSAFCKTKLHLLFRNFSQGVSSCMSTSRSKMNIHNIFVHFIVTSLLWCTASSQSCSNTHNVSTIISYSIHGPSVNDLIGANAYNTIILASGLSFTQSINQRIGLTTFGGNKETGNVTTKLQSLYKGNFLDLISDAIFPTTPDYENEWGNVASEAITLAINSLSGESGRQKYHVIFSATIPLSMGFGSQTTPSNTDDVCTPSIIAKQSGMLLFEK